MRARIGVLSMQEKPSAPSERFSTVPELALEWGVCERTICRLIATGELKLYESEERYGSRLRANRATSNMLASNDICGQHKSMSVHCFSIRREYMRHTSVDG